MLKFFLTKEGWLTHASTNHTTTKGYELVLYQKLLSNKIRLEQGQLSHALEFEQLGMILAWNISEVFKRPGDCTYIRIGAECVPDWLY